MTLTDADKAYHRIKEKIITLKMSPGSIIRESQLMEKLGLGRTPIREGLKRLQSENLVIIASRRGAFVADITITDLQQIYEVRVELDALCARLAAQRTTLAQLAEMKEVIAHCHTEPQEDKIQLMTLDRQFHHLLAQAAGNKFLYKEFELFYNFSLRIWYLALNQVRPEDMDVEAHTEILTAIEAGDGERAAQRMRKHIQHFHSAVRQYL